ncbi:hypothetical protein VUJ46_01980 [Chryseobacterium sp. MYb264]|uniref:hypothetical protein n=1 Tax=Chryseobacterium sp. MYb264 TaxID=2745153 RepID=UPI002E103A00|nr:hypothetical protein VUJ46_01980 [Chryseobacterium sp. MYb264]
MRNTIKRGLLLFTCLFSANALFSQTTAVKIRPNTSSGPNVTAPGNANDTDVNTFAQVNSYGGTALGLLGYSGTLTMGYSNSSDYIPANSKFYLKVNSNETGLLDALLGGSLGNLLKGVLGVVIGGEHVTSFTLKNEAGGNVIAVSTTNSNVNQDKITIAKDASQNYYAVFYPKQAVKTIEVNDKTTFSLLFGGVNNFKVYDSYYFKDNLSDCNVSLLTSYTAAGGLLSLINSEPVSNSHLAIDNDLTTYSRIGITSLLNLNASGTVEQLFHLPKASQEKAVRFKLRMPSGLLKLDVASQSSIVFYKDGAEVSSVKLDSSVLGLDLLGLLNQNNADFSFLAAPRDANGKILPFDKVGIRIFKPLSVNLVNAEDIRVYDVAFVDDAPDQRKVCSLEFLNNNIRTRKFDITQLIPNYNAASDGYIIVDSNQKEIPFKTAAEKQANRWQPLGTYYIKGISDPNYCSGEYIAFMAVEDKQYQITGAASISMPLDANFDGIADASTVFSASHYLSQLPGSTAVRIYDELTNLDVTGQTVHFPKIGTYNYYAKAVNSAGNCDIVKRITVYVYDKQECEYRYVQRMANLKSAGAVLTGGSTNTEKAIDNDLSTYGTIFNALSLAGIGNSWLDLGFAGALTSPIPAGTPMTIKLGQDYGVLQLLGGITLQTLDKNGTPVGPVRSIGELDLLNLLVGSNTIDVSFIPRDASGNAIEYGGVRVLIGSVLGLFNSARIYGMYIDDRIPLTQAQACEANLSVSSAEIPGNASAPVLLNHSAKDVLYGVQDAGLGVATSLSGVLYPYLAADAVNNSSSPLHGTPNYDTAAIFNTSVSVLNKQVLTVKFKDVARPGDKVRIVMSSEGISILDVNVLGGFTIQRYLGNVPVGDEIRASDSQIIKLDLLKLIANQAAQKTAVILDGIGATFDRVELRLNNVVSANLLGNKTYVYDVSVIPYFDVVQDEQSLCLSSPLSVNVLEPCTAYHLSFAYAEKDAAGNITAWKDIPGSAIQTATGSAVQDFINFKLTKMYKQYSTVNNLYLKTEVYRGNCMAGETQYIPVNINGCQSIVNPLIRSMAR